MDDTVLKMVAINYAVNEKRISNEDRAWNSLSTDGKVSTINHLELFLTIFFMYGLNPLFLSLQYGMIVSCDACHPLTPPSGGGGGTLICF